MRIAYSILEAAEATSLGRSTIEEAVATGRLPARKFGARTLILASDLQRLLETLPSTKRAQDAEAARVKAAKGEAEELTPTPEPK
jgi:excisionase family DNA binding protein